ncbi:hypothetical protein [Allochromatium palmeri]|uniref:Uncharacterized protein n=1 Tax=Allochromatium palmeri TaxID=231048 RepID=A0A6N8EEQ9_9GAMM|nr:hypothetical protein [Allochromatium palmeri]MTW22772.1 hypothetical protein [Allochromatium palmeri]
MKPRLDARSTQTLVVVGSAPLKQDLSARIDACDCVIRFNNCKNYGGHSGTRTNILVLSNTGSPNENRTLPLLLTPRTEAEVAEQLPYLAQAQEVWIARPNPQHILALLRSDGRHLTPLGQREVQNLERFGDLAPNMIATQKIPREKVRRIPEQLYTRLWRCLLGFGTTGGIIPSTGMLGIEMALNYTALRHHRKYYIGFGWQGWHGHPWALEERLVNAYVSKGVLAPLHGPR